MPEPQDPESTTPQDDGELSMADLELVAGGEGGHLSSNAVLFNGPAGRP